MHHLIIPFLPCKNIQSILSVLGNLEVNKEVIISNPVPSISGFSVLKIETTWLKVCFNTKLTTFSVTSLGIYEFFAKQSLFTYFCVHTDNVSNNINLSGRKL